MNRENLLSIGDMAKLSKSNIFSLRYYERLGILIPAFIDPDTNYRYYTFEQVYLVNLIMLCVELDIPLKEFKSYIGKNNVVNAELLIEKGKLSALEKMANLEKNLKYISNIKQQIARVEQNEIGVIYKRHIQKKIVYVKPYIEGFNNLKSIDLAKEFFGIPFIKDEYTEYPEYGFICKYSQSQAKYYAFVELPAYAEGENIKILPAGTYWCILRNERQIENTNEIFKEYLHGESFIAFETDIISSKYDVNAPLVELKVLLTPCL